MALPPPPSLSFRRGPGTAEPAFVLHQIAHPSIHHFQLRYGYGSQVAAVVGLIRTIDVRRGGAAVNSCSVQVGGRLLFSNIFGSVNNGGVLTMPAELLATMREGASGRASMRAGRLVDTSRSM